MYKFSPKFDYLEDRLPLDGSSDLLTLSSGPLPTAGTSPYGGVIQTDPLTQRTYTNNGSDYIATPLLPDPLNNKTDVTPTMSLVNYTVNSTLNIVYDLKDGVTTVTSDVITTVPVLLP